MNNNHTINSYNLFSNIYHEPGDLCILPYLHNDHARYILSLQEITW